ncbi:LANO_0F03246g1_1 [Lachancea nothofagi CBS 11611]|uniref:LANO_0F03246g1_1 n=1 Tax=Lachancea nothofagi CBS 11611 TaxID=1266666 RepID=A0A1G4K742_9SACH|nr:LANO_0F03246g1_1 [Lachancea nothofagi CBS 11611]
MGLLSVEQKYNIILMAERHPKWTQLELARWAYEAYQLSSCPSQGTISRLLARKSVFMNSKDHEKGANRLRKPNNLLVRRILQEWVSQSIWNGIPITPPIIQDTAQSVWHRIPAEHREGNGSFTYKWITHFLSKMDVNISNLDAELPKQPKVWTFEERGTLKEILAKIPARDLFTLDETFLAYNLPMDNAQYETSQVQRKIEVLTVMLCANLDGSEKMNPLVIGRYENYRSFRNHFSNDTPDNTSQTSVGERMARKFSLTFHSNRKSWLTSNLFHDWLVWWDKRLVVDNRIICIVLDDSCSHRIINLRLKNIKLVYTSANSRFLPFNWGVLDEFKTHYRVQQYEALIELQEKIEKRTGERKVLTYDQSALNMSNAFKLIQNSWDAIPVDTIKANWKSSGILPQHMIQLNENVSMAFKKNEALERKLNEVSDRFHCVRQWDYDILLDLNIENKNTNFLSSEEIVESAIVDEWEPEPKVGTYEDDYGAGNFNLEAFAPVAGEVGEEPFGHVVHIGPTTNARLGKDLIVSNMIDKSCDIFSDTVLPTIDDNHLENVSVATHSTSNQLYPSTETAPATSAYLDEVFNALPHETPTAPSANPLTSHTRNSLPDSTSPASNSLPPDDILSLNEADLTLGNEFDLEPVNDYLGQSSANQHESGFGNQRLVILTTLQTNIDIAKSMGNILKHAEFREVGLSDRALNELRFSYNNCLKKIRKAKQALSNTEKRQRNQRLERHLMHQDQALVNQSAPPPTKIHGQVDIVPALGIENNAFFTNFPPGQTLDIPSHLQNGSGGSSSRPSS